jgi:methylase of polypeptide subunit release factors
MTGTNTFHNSTSFDAWTARVLEIGCGTGSSVMALVEQGSDVTGVDVVP